MRNNLILDSGLSLIIFFFTVLTIPAQTSSSRWVDMFSYLYITSFQVQENKWYVASENAVFFFYPQTGEYKRFSTIQGINSERITVLFFHPATGRTFIAHRDGHIDIILHDETVQKENGLFLSAIPSDKKKIYDVESVGNKLYLATDIGISEYHIDLLEFGDTFYIGNGGMELKINDLILHDDKLYAATQSEGIKYINESNPSKADFYAWNQTGNGNWKKLFVFNNIVFAVQGNKIYRIEPSLTQVYQAPADIKDVAVNDTHIFIGLQQSILQLDGSFNLQHTFYPSTQYPFKLNKLQADNQNIFLGTHEHGVIKIQLNDGSMQSFHPDCPLYNFPFAADIYDGHIWVVYGDYDELYNPFPLEHYGISRFINRQWNNIHYNKINTTTLTDVKINRQDTSQVFVGSFHEGLLEFRSGQVYQKYDPTNSTIEPIILNSGPYHSYRISPLLFDDDGNLWMFQGLVMNEVHKFSLQTGQWQAYSFSSLMNSAFNEGAADMQFDKDGNLWMATHRLGVVGLNPETGDLVQLTENNNIPYEGNYRNTQATAIDKNNILWIGTLKGLRILRNPSRAFTDPQIQAQPIIIELAELEGEDNQGEELLNNQQITEIVVDGSNYKWIGTSNAGVFYFNEDGQQTIYHFTKENSPLPGNVIYDISVDPISGMVLFSTDNGLIGFKSDATEGKNNLDDAYVYPNPLNMKKHKRLFIRNIMSKVFVKITDVEGNLVYEIQSKGGTVSWDLKNFSGRPVSSGVYFILLSDEKHENNKILKAVIIR